MKKRWEVITTVRYRSGGKTTDVSGEFWTLWGAKRFLSVCTEQDARLSVLHGLDSHSSIRRAGGANG